MSAFAESEGGMLTSKQVDAIVQGMRQRWTNPMSYKVGSAALHSQGRRQLAARSRGVRNILRCVSRRRRQGYGQGRLHCESLLSQLDNGPGMRTIVIVGRRISTRRTGETMCRDIR